MGRLPALLAALAALVLAGCGGGGDHHRKTVPPSTLVAAARATAAAGTFSFTIGGTLAAAGQSFPIQGAGEADVRARRARISLDLSQAVAQSGIQGISPADARADAVAEGDVLYVRSPYLAQRRGVKKPWLRFDSLVLRPLAYLGAVDTVTELGTEEIDGVKATHYAAEVDLRKYAQTAKPGEVAGLNFLMRQIGDSVPIDVWVDPEHRIRRVQLQITTISFEAEPRIDISGFGRPVAVRTPAPALVGPAR